MWYWIFLLNGKDEARQVSSPASFIFIDENVGSLFVCLDQRPVFIFTYLDGRIISEDTDLCVIFLLFLCTVSQGKRPDSGNDGRTKRREKKVGRDELIRSRRRSLTLEGGGGLGCWKEQCLWPVLRRWWSLPGLGGALVETAVQMGALGEAGLWVHDGHPRDSLPTQARLWKSKETYFGFSEPCGPR